MVKNLIATGVTTQPLNYYEDKEVFYGQKVNYPSISSYLSQC